MFFFKYIFCRGYDSQCHRFICREKPFWTPVNISIIFGASAILLTSSATIYLTKFSSFFDSSDTSIFAEEGVEQHPTSIPWIETESECRHTHKNAKRIWSKGKCWDYEHSPDF